MNPLLLLVISLVVVLGSILWMRLHPFLALILGAFAVSGLTSEDALRESMKSKYHGELLRSEIQQRLVTTIDQHAKSGLPWELRSLRLQVEQEVRAQDTQLIAAAEKKAIEFVRDNSVPHRLVTALGKTFQNIGLLIAMACVIGRCLLASGAAERIVRSALAIVGQRGAPFAFAASSFVLSIPVFFDSVFLLVVPLVKATWLKLRRDYLLMVLALITGGTISHSLVPPTPGPMFVAEELGVNIGTMMLVGMAIGLCCTAVGLCCAYWLNSRMDIPLRESPNSLAQLELLGNKPLHELPPMWIALTPVLLPVLLISGATIYESRLAPTQSLPTLIETLGDKNIALSISAAISILMAAFFLRNRHVLSNHLQQTLQEAGLIILVCCAGGAFGAMLEQSGIGPYINSLSGSQPLDFGLLPMAFVVTAVIRGAQGSSTVAMFTAVAIVRSLTPDLSELSYHPVYLAVSIGCGSKPFPWMNDSGFLVISRMSGLTEQETLKTHTPMVTLMGISGLVFTMLAAKLFPMLSS